MFRFEYIEFSYYLILIPVIWIIFLISNRRKKYIINQLGNSSVLNQLIQGYHPNIFWKKCYLTILGLAFIILSGTNPQWGTKRENVKSESSDIFIALDISNSMYAEDIAPNRIERAKRYTQELIKALKGNRIGLIFFAGNAFIQMPLTNDYAAAMLLVKSASPNMAGTQGTALNEAISIAEEGYLGNKNAQRAMVIITDGESHEAGALEVAKEAFENGCTIYTVGVGTEQGAPIPIPIGNRKSYKKDETGNQVLSRLNVDMINELSQAGGGKPFLVTQGKKSINKIVDDLEKLEKREVQVQSFSEFNSYYQYILGIGIVFISLGLFHYDTSKSDNL
jgi:Ca-activated chloride channel family protein